MFVSDVGQREPLVFERESGVPYAVEPRVKFDETMDDMEKRIINGNAHVYAKRIVRKMELETEPEKTTTTIIERTRDVYRDNYQGGDRVTERRTGGDGNGYCAGDGFGGAVNAENGGFRPQLYRTSAASNGVVQSAAADTTDPPQMQTSPQINPTNITPAVATGVEARLRDADDKLPDTMQVRDRGDDFSEEGEFVPRRRKPRSRHDESNARRKNGGRRNTDSGCPCITGQSYAAGYFCPMHSGGPMPCCQSHSVPPGQMTWQPRDGASSDGPRSWESTSGNALRSPGSGANGSNFGGAMARSAPCSCVELARRGDLARSGGKRHPDPRCCREEHRCACNGTPARLTRLPRRDRARAPECACLTTHGTSGTSCRRTNHVAACRTEVVVHSYHCRPGHCVCNDGQR